MNKKTNQSVTINGRRYDAHSGLALEVKVAPRSEEKLAQTNKKNIVVISDIVAPPPAEKTPHRTVKRAKVPAQAVHASTRKSTTLRREHIKKPRARRPSNAKTIHRTVEQSHRITKFAPIPTSTKSALPQVDEALAQQAKTLQDSHAKHVVTQKNAARKPYVSSRAVKEHLLKTQLAAAPSVPLSEAYEAGAISRKARIMSVATTSLALILLGGYLTYINIPNLSIRIASGGAGINASLPQYQPGGFRLHGPIAYAPGEVEVRYQQNGGREGYKIIQKASDWDPQAALDNYVTPDSNDDYQIRSVQGLTVYTYDKKAVWVNGGILHVIDGQIPLSGQQVERIAASM